MSLAGYALIVLAAPEAVTATGTEAGLSMKDFSGEARLILSSGAGGSGTTMNAKIEHSDDGTTWSDSGFAFAQVGNAASHQVIGVNVDRFKKFIRVAQTVAGTTPSFSRSVFILAKSDRVPAPAIVTAPEA